MGLAPACTSSKFVMLNRNRRRWTGESPGWLSREKRSVHTKCNYLLHVYEVGAWVRVMTAGTQAWKEPPTFDSRWGALPPNNLLPDGSIYTAVNPGRDVQAGQASQQGRRCQHCAEDPQKVVPHDPDLYSLNCHWLSCKTLGITSVCHLGSSALV